MADASRLSFATRRRLFAAALLSLATGRHGYVSTSCLHGEHEYCQSMTGMQGDKRPAQCKFCDAVCRCGCHVRAAAGGQ